MAEAEALRRGSVIELACPLGEARLALRVGDRQTSTGRLVVLAEGRVGVILDVIRR